MGEIRFLAALEGDIKVEWDETKDDEVDSARKFFNEKLADGYKAYRFNRVESRGEEMRYFDPTAKRIILAKPIVGG